MNLNRFIFKTFAFFILFYRAKFYKTEKIITENPDWPPVLYIGREEHHAWKKANVLSKHGCRGADTAPAPGGLEALSLRIFFLTLSISKNMWRKFLIKHVLHGFQGFGMFSFQWFWKCVLRTRKTVSTALHRGSSYPRNLLKHTDNHTSSITFLCCQTVLMKWMRTEGRSSQFLQWKEWKVAVLAPQDEATAEWHSRAQKGITQLLMNFPKDIKLSRDRRIAFAADTAQQLLLL